MQDVTHDMPLNETDKAWVRETIRDAHKRSRLGKFTSFLKEWSGVGAAMAFLLLVFTQWNTYIEFRTRTDDRLKSIEDDLRILKKFSANGAASSLADAGKYAKEGKIELAVKAAQQAAETITSAASGKVPASPGYFVDTVEMINGVAQVSSSSDLSANLQDARLALAQYRSSLLVGTITYSNKLKVATKWIVPNKSKVVGGYLDISKIPGDFAIPAPAYRASLADAFEFQGTLFSGGTQTLDEIRWVNVTFIGTKIRYNGGRTYLDHVRFVGCTFAAPDNDRGARFAEYAALLLPTFNVG